MTMSGRLLKHTNEFTQRNCAKQKLESLRNRQQVKQPAPRPLSIRRARIDLIMRNAEGQSHDTLRGRMWSFANTLGSHSLHTKLKTHYSEQLHSYNNPLENLISVKLTWNVDVVAICELEDIYIEGIISGTIIVSSY